MLENGACFSSYTLMDHGKFTEELLRERLVEDTDTRSDGRVQQVSLVSLFSQFYFTKHSSDLQSHRFYGHLLWIYLDSEAFVCSQLLTFAWFNTFILHL